MCTCSVHVRMYAQRQLLLLQDDHSSVYLVGATLCEGLLQLDGSSIGLPELLLLLGLPSAPAALIPVPL